MTEEELRELVRAIERAGHALDSAFGDVNRANQDNKLTSKQLHRLAYTFTVIEGQAAWRFNSTFSMAVAKEKEEQHV